ncbi:homeobox protein Mohawk, partial [Tachysurus ichikawai]
SRQNGGKVRHKRQALQDMARPLKQWLYKHRDNPYPTKTEKILLALGSQMTLVQIRADKWLREICNVFHRSPFQLRRTNVILEVVHVAAILDHEPRPDPLHTASFVFYTRHWLPSRLLKLKAVRARGFFEQNMISK